LKSKRNRLKIRHVGRLFKLTFSEFFSENSFFHGAALAYYAVFSIVPIVYLAAATFGRVLGQEQVMTLLENLLENQMGMENPEGILEYLSQVNFEKSNVILNIIGTFALLFSSSALISSLRTSINEFYDVHVVFQDSKLKFYHTVITKLISVFMLAFFGFCIVMLYVTETIFMSVSSSLYEAVGIKNLWLMSFSEHFLSVAVNVVVFALVYKYVHDGKVRWKIAFLGGIFTSLLLFLGQIGLKFYLKNYFFGSQLGIVGTILIFLVWIYYTSQIIFLGAKFIKVYSQLSGESIVFHANRLLQFISSSREK
jgi:membrane protein